MESADSAEVSACHLGAHDIVERMTSWDAAAGSPLHGRIEPEPTPWALPDPALAPPGSDVVGIGADLAPGTVLAAYRRGLFPMDVERGGPLGWWSPDPRGVLPLESLRVSRSLRRSLRRFEITVDACFTEVMLQCAHGRGDHGWITDDFVDTYSQLHRLGWAHSVEVWNGAGDLVGGLYGIEVGGLFAGESMFHRQRDASKVALVALVHRLAGTDPAAGNTRSDQRLLDVQWVTEHLASLGAVAIPRREYLQRLAIALTLPPVLSG
jgi:leucyl/phenylalanyl-tRNA--protein transferase